MHSPESFGYPGWRLSVLAFVLMAAPADSPAAQAVLPTTDKAGSADPQLKRYGGAVILSDAQTRFDEFDLPTAALDAEGSEPSGVPSANQFWPLTQTLNAPSGPLAGQFGISVDMSGDWLVVGAPMADVDGTQGGSVHVYRRVDDAWLPDATLTSPAGAQHGAHFGASVSIASTAGRVVIAIGESTRDAIGSMDVGALWIYERNGNAWSNVASGTGGAGLQWLGYAIDTDGSIVLAGAPSSNGFLGATQTWRRTGGQVWTLDHTTQPDSTDEVAGYYGFSVALSGAIAVVGARAGGSQTLQGVAELSNVVAGGPLAQPIVLHDPTPMDLDNFGWSVAASGNRFAIGSIGDDDPGGTPGSGAVHVFRLSGQTVVHETTLRSPAPQENAQFGASLAFADDLLVVGEPVRTTFLFGSQFAAAGSASVFRRVADPGFWVRETSFYNFGSNERMGSGVACQGSRLAVGIPLRALGAVAVHQRDSIFANGFDDTAPE